MKSYLRKLEYDIVLTNISKFAHSSLGRELVNRLSPAKEKVLADRLNRETIAASELFQSNKSPRISNLDQLGDILNAIDEDTIVLDAPLIRFAGDALIEMDAFADVLQEYVSQRKVDVFAGYSREIPRLQESGRYFKSIIGKDGEVKNSASKKLSQLVMQTRGLKQRLSKKIDRISSSLSAGGVLREAPPTIRDGRHVLPVIATHKRAVLGIVHDRSESGGTFFIEPAEIIEDGNELRESELDMEYEIRRILKEATGRLREKKTEIKRGFEILTELDAIFARAIYHLENETVFPEPGVVALLQLRHPLIHAEEIVYNDVILPADWKVLVVSGPNAGGKSVLLKSIGLAVACSQSGIGAFAAPGSTLPFFTDVLVSLGDNQSISEHESTYSGRLREQLQMLDRPEKGRLALIDEPAGGTDPVTGAALALSVLEYLAEAGCRAIVTTHMGQLKNSAENRQGFINGSMNFGIESTEPDYEFRLGLPGSSYTLEIARNIGFPEDILDYAKELSADSFHLDNLIEELSEKTGILNRDIAACSKETIESRKQNAKLHLELKEKSDELEAAKKRVLEENEEIAKAYNSRADSLLSRLGRAGDSDKRIAIRREIKEMSENLATRKKELSIDDESNLLAIGDCVAISCWNGTGIIEEVSKDSYVVRIGNVRLRCSASELSPATSDESTELNIEYNAPVTARFEIDLRGMSSEEAIAELDRSIDDCISAGMTIIRVIHGKGEGVLMRVINRSMKSDKRVLSHRMGEPSEGGTGVTVAKLKK